MKLYDCFTFFNELDLLEIRLNYLNSVVDHFVICEADVTQSGLQKPFYFEENKERFAPFKDKIIYIRLKVDPDKTSAGWDMEHFQRNALLNGLEGASGEDLVMVSDLDEIPNKNLIKENMLSVYNLLRTVSFSHIYCAYYVDLYCPYKRWFGTVLTTIREARARTPQGLRNQKDHMDHILGTYTQFSGFHFSWLGGFESFKNKNISCVEPYNKNLDFAELEREYKRAACNGGYFLHSDNIGDKSVSLSALPYELLPSYLVENKEKYKELFLK